MKTLFAKIALFLTLLPVIAGAQLTTMRDSTSAQLMDFVDLTADRSNISAATLIGKSFFDSKVGAYFVAMVAAFENRSFNNEDFTTLSLALTQAKQDSGILTISNTTTIKSDTTIGGNAALVVLNNGRINIADAGDSLTISMPFQAGLRKVFLGNGTVHFTAGTVREVYPEWWGSDAAAINSAIQSLPTTGGRVVLTRNITITDSILIDKNGVEFVGAGYSASATVPTSVMITKNGNFAGITVTASGVIIANIHIDGAASNKGPGISIQQSRFAGYNLTTTDMGNYGVWVGRNVTNANLWRIYNLVSNDNDSSGFYVHDDGGGAPDVNEGILWGGDFRDNGTDGIQVNNALDCEFYGVHSASNGRYGAQFQASAKGHFMRGYFELNTTADGILLAGSEDNEVHATRSSVSTSFTNNGNDNLLKVRFGSINDMFWYSGNVAYDSLHVGQATLSGLWKFRMNTSSRNLEIALVGTGSSPVSAKIQHDNAGIANFEVEDGGLKLRDGALIDSIKVVVDSTIIYIGANKYPITKTP